MSVKKISPLLGLPVAVFAIASWVFLLLVSVNESNSYEPAVWPFVGWAVSSILSIIPLLIYVYLSQSQLNYLNRANNYRLGSGVPFIVLEFLTMVLIILTAGLSLWSSIGVMASVAVFGLTWAVIVMSFVCQIIFFITHNRAARRLNPTGHQFMALGVVGSVLQFSGILGIYIYLTQKAVNQTAGRVVASRSPVPAGPDASQLSSVNQIRTEPVGGKQSPEPVSQPIRPPATDQTGPGPEIPGQPPSQQLT